MISRCYRLIIRLKLQSVSFHSKPQNHQRNHHPNSKKKKKKSGPSWTSHHSYLYHLKSISDPILAVRHLLSSPPSIVDYPSCSSLIYRLSRVPYFIPVLLSFLSFIHVRRVPLREPLFSTLIQNLGDLGLPDVAIRVFNSINRFNVPPNCPSKISLNSVLNSLVDNGRLDHARDMLDSCPKLGIHSNIVSYNIIIKGYCKNGDFDGASKVLDEMVDRRNIRPSVVTFNILIGFLCKKESVDSAMRLKEEMVTRWKVPPNQITYAMIMKKLCEEAKCNDAKKLMFDMEYQNCKAGLINYGVLINDCVKRDDYEGINELLSEMKKRKLKPDHVIYNMIIGYLCKEGKVHDAYKILMDMQIKDKCETSAATFRVLVDGCCRVNEFELGFRVLNIMLVGNHWPKSETLVCLIKGLCENKNVEEACFVLEEMEKKGKFEVDLVAWMALVKCFCVDNERVVTIYCK